MRRPSQPRLRCEPLEDRTTPATFTVTTAADVVDPNDGLVCPALTPIVPPVIPPVVPPDVPVVPPVVVPVTPSVPLPSLATGAAAGQSPEVRVYDADGKLLKSFLAYDAGFTGGVTVAVGDVTGDGIPDVVTAAGVGGAPHVKVFDGATFAEFRSFFAYDAGFVGGVSVAVGDVTGDGIADIVTGAGAGGAPHVKAFDGVTGKAVKSFFAYAAGFRGGVSVAVVERAIARLRSYDGSPDVWEYSPGHIVTGAGAGGGPHIKMFDGETDAVLLDHFAFDPSFRGGVNVATIKSGQMFTPLPTLYSDEAPKPPVTYRANYGVYTNRLAVAQASGGSSVALFDTINMYKYAEFDPFDGFTGGVRLASLSLDTRAYAGGTDELIVETGSGGSPRVLAYDVSNSSLPHMVRYLFPVPDVQPVAPPTGDPANGAPSVTDPNWVATGSGLKTWDVRPGDGPAVAANSTIIVRYTGWLANGTVIDTTGPNGNPATFPLQQLIQGWQEGLLGMKVGGIRRLCIPPELAYGVTGNPPTIPPNATLLFEVELISVS